MATGMGDDEACGVAASVDSHMAIGVAGGEASGEDSGEDSGEASGETIHEDIKSAQWFKQD